MRTFFGIFMITVLIGCSEKQNEPLTFSVMEDVPRSEEENGILQKQISDFNIHSKSEFMVHVGVKTAHLHVMKKYTKE